MAGHCYHCGTIIGRVRLVAPRKLISLLKFPPHRVFSSRESPISAMIYVLDDTHRSKIRAFIVLRRKEEG